MQKAGKSGRRKGLADKSLRPERFVYQRPASAELTTDQEMVLTPEGTCTLRLRAWTYRGKVVDFAMTQMANEVEDPRSGEDHVARCDCCHSEVHKHQYYRSTRHYRTGETEQRTVIAPIDDQRTSWETVDSAYETCCDDMIDGWTVNYRRWDTDGEHDN